MYYNSPMNIRQVKEFYKDKENTPCPLTDKLISSGYKQTSGGYIKIAKEKGIKNPTQYWHLMNYCDMVDENKTFSKSIVCGELIFWMAEVSGAVPKQELESLLNEIITGNIKDRKKWNKRIQEVCFDSIAIESE